jgi:hypothetical protein
MHERNEVMNDQIQTIKIYNVDQNTGAETFELECSFADFVEANDNDDNAEVREAIDHLREDFKRGGDSAPARYVGGGAAPLVRIVAFGGKL